LLQYHPACAFGAKIALLPIFVLCFSKYYEEVVLLEQKFIRDDKIKIYDFIKLSESSVSSELWAAEMSCKMERWG